MGEPLAYGQLAAAWMEAFGSAVLDEPGPWPDVLLLDSTEFWRRKNFRKTAALTVLMVYGYDLAYGPHPEPPDPFMGPAPNYRHGRLLAAMVFPPEP